METTTHTTTGRRETPDARLVLSIDAPRTEWLAFRRLGITATDLPAITGLSKYKTAIDVWTEKVLPAADRDETAMAEAAFWGIRLEEPVAQAWAENNNVKIRRVGLISNVERPWTMASLDRLVVGGCEHGGRCGLEVKTRSLFVSDDWEKDVPVDVEAQVRWQLLVSGLDHIHVVALIGGQRLVSHIVERNEAHEQYLLSAAEIVWQAVQAETAPEMPEHLWTDDYLAQRHPERAGTIELDPSVSTTLDEYQNVSIAVTALENRKSLLRTQLVGALGEYEVGLLNGKTAYTYKASQTRRIDTKALKVTYPQIESDDTVWNTTTTRTLRVSTTKDKA